MDARTIIFDYFDGTNLDLNSLMDFLDTDTLVDWFVCENYVDNLDEEEHDIIMEYYDCHCA